MHISTLNTWAVITIILAIVSVWLWFFLWAPIEEHKSRLYSVRCVQCKWYAIAPTDVEAAQMYAKHYEADHS